MTPSSDRFYRDPNNASVLITGASSGIGAALATRLARYGNRIALVARRGQLLEAVAARVVDGGASSATPVVADVTDLASVRQAHRQIIAAQGPVDVAFLNAGVGDHMSLRRFDAEHFKQIFDTNVFGVVNWLEVLLPAMIERRHGTLVGTSSLAASRGLPSTACYGASKAALSHLLESIAIDSAAYGIRVSILEPGFVSTKNEKRRSKPFTVDVEVAAREIVDRVARGERWVRFPWPLSTATRVLRLLPAALYERLIRRGSPRS